MKRLDDLEKNKMEKLEKIEERLMEKSPHNKNPETKRQPSKYWLMKLAIF